MAQKLLGRQVATTTPGAMKGRSNSDPIKVIEKSNQFFMLITRRKKMRKERKCAGD